MAGLYHRRHHQHRRQFLTHTASIGAALCTMSAPFMVRSQQNAENLDSAFEKINLNKDSALALLNEVAGFETPFDKQTIKYIAEAELNLRSRLVYELGELPRETQWRSPGGLIDTNCIY
jgi:hypothetical protein